MKYYKNYVLKKINDIQIEEINKQHKIALEYYNLQNIKIDPPIIPYQYNKKYVWYKVDN